MTILREPDHGTPEGQGAPVTLWIETQGGRLLR